MNRTLITGMLACAILAATGIKSPSQGTINCNIGSGELTNYMVSIGVTVHPRPEFNKRLFFDLVQNFYWVYTADLVSPSYAVATNAALGTTSIIGPGTYIASCGDLITLRYPVNFLTRGSKRHNVFDCATIVASASNAGETRIGQLDIEMGVTQFEKSFLISGVTLQGTNGLGINITSSENPVPPWPNPQPPQPPFQMPPIRRTPPLPFYPGVQMLPAGLSGTLCLPPESSPRTTTITAEFETGSTCFVDTRTAESAWSIETTAEGGEATNIYGATAITLNVSNRTCLFYRVRSGTNCSVTMARYEIAIPANGQALIANQLEMPQPIVANLFKGSPAGFFVETYLPESGWTISSTDGSNWINGDVSLFAGEGAIVHNPTADTLYIVLEGAVPFERAVLGSDINQGHSICSFVQPKASDLDSLGFPKTDGNIVSKLLSDGTWKSYVYTNGLWFTSSNSQWIQEIPRVEIGEAIAVDAPSANIWGIIPPTLPRIDGPFDSGITNCPYDYEYCHLFNYRESVSGQTNYFIVQSDGQDYYLESAPTLNGPWQSEVLVPANLSRVAVAAIPAAGGDSRFFRLSDTYHAPEQNLSSGIFESQYASSSLTLASSKPRQGSIGVYFATNPSYPPLPGNIFGLPTFTGSDGRTYFDDTSEAYLRICRAAAEALKTKRLLAYPTFTPSTPSWLSAR